MKERDKPPPKTYDSFSPRDVVVGDLTKTIHPDDIVYYKNRKGQVESDIIAKIGHDGEIYLSRLNGNGWKRKLAYIIIPVGTPVKITCTHKKITP
ncbi:hypothetical protein A2954_01605 [Candidatus Roizmanbacteria bacterium RIFCSPLOWO2_01_FULL_37_12]|uniref:Uncharacterized protein n=1 Tax=Candidatus Roizmanbacteria bacterium RIFCSPLOWO2_01_FULL_37_12 TaxID=1802056 RepID=A0A1F7IA02_9BACT|nr:MAG: hypothetical protein A3D76_05495 [Candidatus Roizmanbacteria bacterium RIFCSPHIGHO2_02_FULL_37_9b]OGK40191.1 MAG: hypothetical protein A2954_01605 [Candidatus Roizmanbacteria bacterium RIFCSPLOWO2_01_FULL_37_12]